MKNKIIILGQASGKIIKSIEVSSEDLKTNISLMDFLFASGITIASSCGGEGLCHKCVVNDDLISCKETLFNFLSSHQLDQSDQSPIIRISYL